MTTYSERLTLLRAQFTRWDELLAGASEAAITAARPPDGASVKDVVGHLHAWQQVSLARLEAARAGVEPTMPAWLHGADPESDAELEVFNARIAAVVREQPWAAVYGAWRDGFVRLLQLAEGCSEATMYDTTKYPWLRGHALIAVLEGSYGHHHEDHLPDVLAWLGVDPGPPG